MITTDYNTRTLKHALRRIGPPDEFLRNALTRGCWTWDERLMLLDALRRVEKAMMSPRPDAPDADTDTLIRTLFTNLDSPDSRL